MGLMATVIGWHDHRNTGDDAMLQVIVWALHRYLHCISVRVLCDPANLPHIHTEGPAVHSSRLLRGAVTGLANPFIRARAARRAKVLVFGGGSLWHSENSVAWKSRILRSFRRARPDGIAMALGVSFGPFHSVLAERAALEFVGQLDGVLARDRESFEFACGAGGRDPVVRLSCDLALLLPRSSGVAWPGSGIREKKLLGLSLVGGKKSLADQEGRIEWIAGIVRARAEAGLTSRVALIECCGDSRHGDRSPTAALAALCQQCQIPVDTFPYSQAPMDMLKSIQMCGLFLGERLHSQVYSYMAGVPFVSLSDSRKSTGFLGMVGLPKESIFAGNDSERLLTCLASSIPAPQMPFELAERETWRTLENVLIEVSAR